MSGRLTRRIITPPSAYPLASNAISRPSRRIAGQRRRKRGGVTPFPVTWGHSPRLEALASDIEQQAQPGLQAVSGYIVAEKIANLQSKGSGRFENSRSDDAAAVFGNMHRYFFYNRGIARGGGH